MVKSGMEFKVRRWTDSAHSTPFDVVALDYDNNKQHYHPDNVMFSTKENAQRYADSLSNGINNNPDRIGFIRDYWPVDAGIF